MTKTCLKAFQPYSCSASKQGKRSYSSQHSSFRSFTDCLQYFTILRNVSVSDVFQSCFMVAASLRLLTRCLTPSGCFAVQVDIYCFIFSVNFTNTWVDQYFRFFVYLAVEFFGIVFIAVLAPYITYTPSERGYQDPSERGYHDISGAKIACCFGIIFLCI